METSNKYYEQVWRFFSQTRALYGFYGSVQKIIQLLFLKSISDDASDYPVRSVDDMKVLFKYQKNISEGTVDPQLLRDTFEIVGDTFFGHAVEALSDPERTRLVLVARLQKSTLQEVARTHDPPQTQPRVWNYHPDRYGLPAFMGFPVASLGW